MAPNRPSLCICVHVNPGLGCVTCLDNGRFNKSRDSGIACTELQGLSSSTTALKLPRQEKARLSHVESSVFFLQLPPLNPTRQLSAATCGTLSKCAEGLLAQLIPRVPRVARGERSYKPLHFEVVYCTAVVRETEAVALCEGPRKPQAG